MIALGLANKVRFSMADTKRDLASRPMTSHAVMHLADLIDADDSGALALNPAVALHACRGIGDIRAGAWVSRLELKYKLRMNDRRVIGTLTADSRVRFVGSLRDYAAVRS